MHKAGGYDLIVDIQRCDAGILSSKTQLQDFTISFCKFININRVGDCKFYDIDTGYFIFQLLDGGCFLIMVLPKEQLVNLLILWPYGEREKRVEREEVKKQVELYLGTNASIVNYEERKFMPCTPILDV